MNSSASSASPSAVAQAQVGAGWADLHLHSFFSDGTFSPEQLAQLGARLGMTALALTDHDSVEGCEPLALACQSMGLEHISGIELTAEFNAHEVHLLGYFIDVRNPNFLAQIKKFQTVRQDRIREMVARLNHLGIPLGAESVFALANCHSPGRPHVARALAQQGLCEGVDEAFDRFLKKNRPAWVPKYKISARDAVDLIHQAGGLAVLAHPALNHCDPIIPHLAAQGLDGLECFHSKHTKTQNQYYLALAARLRLLVTGGSDCHGYSKGKPLIGGVKLPGLFLEKLKLARRS